MAQRTLFLLPCCPKSYVVSFPHQVQRIYINVLVHCHLSNLVLLQELIYDLPYFDSVIFALSPLHKRKILIFFSLSIEPLYGRTQSDGSMLSWVLSWDSPCIFVRAFIFLQKTFGSYYLWQGSALRLVQLQQMYDTHLV